MASRNGQEHARVSACLGAVVLLASHALANPTGPTVTSGNAAFTNAGNLLTVTSAPGSVINWQSFSIGAGEVTQFLQQSSASAVLNRVTSGNASTILGMLSSNGQVFLLNPNGVIFGPGSQVNTASFTVSTGQLSDSTFLSGGSPSGGSTMIVSGPFSVAGEVDLSVTTINMTGPGLSTSANITITTPDSTPPTVPGNLVASPPGFISQPGSALTVTTGNTGAVLSADFSASVVAVQVGSGSTLTGVFSGQPSGAGFVIIPGANINAAGVGLIQGVAAFGNSQGLGIQGGTVATTGGTTNPGSSANVAAPGGVPGVASGSNFGSAGFSTGPTRTGSFGTTAGALPSTPVTVPTPAAGAGSTRVVLQKREPLY